MSELKPTDEEYYENFSHKALVTMVITSLDTRYMELIMAVESAHQNESRHETALRYITERENRCGKDAMDAKIDKPPHGASNESCRKK